MQSIIDDQENNLLTFFQTDKWEEWSEYNLKLRRHLGRNSIALYSKYMDTVINFGIRNKRLSEIGFVIANRLLRLINNAKLIPEKLMLFRGVKDYFLDLNVGDTINDPAFMSKSLSHEISKWFTHKGCCIIIVGYEAGSLPFLYTDIVDDDDYTGNEFSEYEFITYPNEIIKVNSIQELNFNGETIKSYICSYEGLDNTNMLSLVDISIDRSFREYYENLKKVLNAYEYIGVLFKDKVWLIHNSNTNKDFFKNLSEALHIQEDFYNIYAKFCSGRIKKITGVRGINETLFPSNKTFFEYVKDGIKVKKYFDTPNSAEMFYRQVFSGGITYTNLQNNIETYNFTFPHKPPDTPDYYVDGNSSDIFSEESKYLEYDDDIRDSLTSLYGIDPMISNIMKMQMSDIAIELEPFISALQNTSLIEMANYIGMILLPNSDQRQYYLDNIVDYYSSHVNQMSIMLQNNYYYPSMRWNDMPFPEELVSKDYFIPYTCNGVQNLILENATVRFVGKPMIAYGNLKRYVCLTIEELKRRPFPLKGDVTSLETILTIMNLN